MGEYRMAVRGARTSDTVMVDVCMECGSTCERMDSMNYRMLRIPVFMCSCGERWSRVEYAVVRRDVH
jgi:hypothetical protein